MVRARNILLRLIRDHNVRYFGVGGAVWTDELRAREEKILQACDKVVYVRQEYEKGVFLLRDRKLVDGSAYCVSYCNQPQTGTAYTVKYALNHGVKVFNASSFNVMTLK